MGDMNEQSGPPPGNPTGTTAPDPQGGPRVSPQQMRDVNRLRRSKSDRYIAGVAGGLGRHFDIDPTIVRVLLAVLTFFGGAGVIIYGVIWLFVPEDGEDRAPVDLNPEVLKIVLVVTGAIALMIVFGTPFFNDTWFPFPLLIIGLVVLAVFATRDRRRPGPVPPPPWGGAPTPGATQGTPTGTAPTSTPQEGSTMSTDTHTEPYPPTSYQSGQQPPAWMPPPPPTYVPPPRPRRTGLVLFWPTLALIAIGLGTLGIVDVNTPVTVSAYAALAVAITAVMLLVGAFVGRPGGLIALGLVASLGLLITSGVDAATDGDTRGETLNEAPANATLVRDQYRIPNGELTLDLSAITDLTALDGREIDVRLNAGDLQVVLPRGLNAIVDAEMHVVGDIDIDGTHRSGFDQSLTRTVTGSTNPDAPTITLHLDARVGQISVDQD
jgi:phage shock protein PspC (stress-responsive transcriptional regulator)/FtsH-binding integral membrane protein